MTSPRPCPPADLHPLLEQVYQIPGQEPPAWEPEPLPLPLPLPIEDTRP